MYSKLIVHTALMEDGRYVLTATDVEGFVIEPKALANLLFIWDEASFYGTKLEINDALGGIVLDAWGIVSLFSQDSFPSLVDWEWDEFSFLFLSTAPVLYDSIKSGVPIPDFSSLQSEQIGWQLPKQVLEEFEPDFWKSSIVFSNDEELPTKDFIHTLYNQAADTYLKSFAPNHEKWEAALSALKKSQLTSEELQEFFTEERWSKWIGVQEDPKPFTAGLRLIEPLDGEGPWELEIILRSKKDETDIHVYGKEKKLPRGWKAHLHAVEEEIQGWLSLIPWLGTNGRIKQELSEAEAWDFLTEASEKLLFLGAEILLPSWWNAIKESQLKVKARVKSQSTKGPSYVGLNALMDFDWRISMNGADLTEEEFQQLVSDKRRLVYIKGQWVKLDPSLIKQIQELMKTADNKGIPLSELFYQELLQEEVMEDEEEDLSDFMKIQFELNKDLKKLMASLQEVKSIPMQEAPPSFQGSLRPYQVQGLSWLLYLRKHGFGACLADDMGLGKTVQVISYLLSVKEQEDLEAVDTSVSAKKDEAAADPLLPVNTSKHVADPSLPVKKEEAAAVTSLPVKKDEAAAITSLPTKNAETGDVSSLPTKNAETDAVSSLPAKNAETDAVSSLPSKNAETGAVSSLPAKKAALIVCPTSVLGNWQRELEKFAPSLKVYLHYGSNRVKGEDFADFVGGYDVVLTTYGMTHGDFEELSSVYWSSVILDEAQNIKNASTKQSRAARKLKGRHHIALTGTPMENRLSELWAIFDFINKGYLGTLRQFQEKYVASIERDQETEKIKDLQRLIQPFLLRRTKKDKDVALNLPDKLEQKEFVPLTSEQASLYEQLLKDTFAQIDKLSTFERKGVILQMLTKLKQICNHPALYLKEEKVAFARERSAKLDKLFELMDAVMEQNESSLIFTQYIGMGEMIQSLFEQHYGIKVPFLNGSVSKNARDEMISRFQNGEFPIFILSLKAGGTGLNLTAANHVIHYDRWWNPAVENQATDRAYRIGQKRFVHVHKLICTGTLEEKIDQMLDKKQALNDEIIQSDNWITELSTEEIKELVALT